MNNIKNIDFSLSYEGYLWMSNETHPRVFDLESKVDAHLFDTKNPFVVEGYLFNKQTGISISIKYIDGRYYIYNNVVVASDLNSKDIDFVYYLTQRMNTTDKQWAVFLRYWKEKADSSCLGMNVLEVEKEVFIGFKSKEE